MPKKRPPKRDEQRTDRLKNGAQNGPEGPLAEDDAIDAAIKRSIDEFGA
jgi:hypothetical protein